MKILFSIFYFLFSRELRSRRGQLLLELLIGIAIAVFVAAAAGEIIFVSLKSNQSGAGKNVALGLAQSTFDSVKSAATENWLNLYNLTHSSSTATYYPQQSSSKWIITATGSENVAISNDTFTRSFYVQHICRDASTKGITGVTDTQGVSTSSCATSGGSADPSTEKITATVSWPNGGPITYSDYLTRWRNIVCAQTAWTGSATTTPATCPSNNYGSETNVTVGATLQLCSPSC